MSEFKLSEENIMKLNKVIELAQLCKKAHPMEIGVYTEMAIEYLEEIQKDIDKE